MPPYLILFVFFSVVAIFAVFGFYVALTDWAYRRPKRLFFAGVIAAAFAVFLKGIPILMKSLPNSGFKPEELDFVALSVDPLLGGLAGGLVAAAVIVKLQIMHAETQISAYQGRQFAYDDVNHARLHYQRVNETKGAIPENESDKDVERAIDMLCRALERRRDAEKRLREVSVPGL